MPTNSKNQHQSRPLKKSYSSPTLTHFGAIKELTAGGSGENEMKGDKDVLTLKS